MYVPIQPVSIVYVEDILAEPNHALVTESNRTLVGLDDESLPRLGLRIVLLEQVVLRTFADLTISETFPSICIWPTSLSSASSVSSVSPQASA